MRIWQGYEKRDWGGEKPTWRTVQPELKRYRRGTSGQSQYAVRRVTNKRAKMLVFGGSEMRPY